jgi:hypothetical protein
MDRTDPIEDSRRRRLIQALGAAAAGTFLPVTALAQNLFGQAPGRLPAGQSIFRLAGAVTIDGQAATLQTPVRAGSTVETGENSEAVFVVGGHSMLVRAQSKVVLEAGPAPAAATGSLVLGALRILSGKLLSVSRDSPMRIITSTATVGIRGTGWYVEADPDLTYFCTCYGTTDIVANDDPASRETVAAKQHDRPLYIAREGAEGQRIRNAPFINHTDQELALIEALVGRQPPFVFPRDTYNAPRRTY